MDTTRSKTTLDNFEASTRAENHVAGRDADVIERDMAVAMRGIIKADNRKHTINRDSSSVGGYENDRLPFILVRVGRIGLSQNNEDLATGITGSATPPFLSYFSVAPYRESDRP